jgi:hypothetical protein
MKSYRRFLSLTLISLLLLNLPTFAWDGVGHMAVAYVAYQSLTPTSKAKVKKLLKLNPYYKNKKWAALIPAGTSSKDRDMLIFMLAATWPDEIKSDKTYTEDGAAGSNGDRPDGPDSSRNIGYSDLFMHKYWHFIDTPFSVDAGATLPAIPTPDAEDRIDAFRAVLSSSTATSSLKSYDLVWLMHLVGDVHQPLHCSTRVISGATEGDNGGNSVTISCPSGCNSASELHALWDNVLGAGSSAAKALTAVKTLPPPDPTASSDVTTHDWVTESFNDAKTKVYVDPIGPGDGKFTITQQYEDDAVALGSQRIALAGVRLAKVINDELK